MADDARARRLLRHLASDRRAATAAPVGTGPAATGVASRSEASCNAESGSSVAASEDRRLSTTDPDASCDPAAPSATADSPDGDTGLRGGPDRRGDAETVARAYRALSDLEAAATLVEDGGVDDLAAAADRLAAEDHRLARRGRVALAAYRAFRRAAAGAHFRPDHFRRGLRRHIRRSRVGTRK